MKKQKLKTILRSTNEGGLYFLASDFFELEQVQKEVQKLMDSELYKQIKEDNSKVKEHKNASA